jgi:hypothetical protein
VAGDAPAAGNRLTGSAPRDDPDRPGETRAERDDRNLIELLVLPLLRRRMPSRPG